MPIVGFNFTKINIEKTGKLNPNQELKSGIKLTKVEPEKLGADTSKELVKIGFEFTINYAGAGSALLLGNLAYIGNPEKIKLIVDKFNEKKVLPEDIAPNIYNSILFRCNIKTLNLAQDVGLPPHIQLPRVVKKEN